MPLNLEDQEIIADLICVFTDIEGHIAKFMVELIIWIS
jgi:hypothetical protein